MFQDKKSNLLTHTHVPTHTHTTHTHTHTHNLDFSADYGVHPPLFMLEFDSHEVAVMSVVMLCTLSTSIIFSI